MSDDYASRLKCGNLLARQYRYREAVELYRRAERIRQDDPALYLRLGGALLTLFRPRRIFVPILRSSPLIRRWI